MLNKCAVAAARKVVETCIMNLPKIGQRCSAQEARLPIVGRTSSLKAVNNCVVEDVM